MCDKALLHHTVEDGMQFAVGIVLLATQAPIICARYFGKCLQRETGYLKVAVKRRDRTYKRWTDNRQS